MSAPDTADVAPVRHYFADYEVYDGGQRVAWGQATLACLPSTAAHALRVHAADQQGVDAGAIRLRNICRL